MSPRRSKAISFPSGLTSRDSQVPSVTSIFASCRAGPCGSDTFHFLSSFFCTSAGALAAAPAFGASFFCDCCFCNSCDSGRGSCSAFSGFLASAFFPSGGTGGGVWGSADGARMVMAKRTIRTRFMARKCTSRLAKETGDGAVDHPPNDGALVCPSERGACDEERCDAVQSGPEGLRGDVGIHGAKAFLGDAARHQRTSDLVSGVRLARAGTRAAENEGEFVEI